MNRFFGCSATGVLIELIFQSRLWRRHDIDQPLDYVLWPDTFRLRGEVGQDAMAEYRIVEGLNIFHSYVVTADHKTQSIRAENKELRRPQAGDIIEIMFYDIRRIR